jgi:hypothetical protein
MIGCSALDPDPNNVVAPAAAGSAIIAKATTSAAAPLTLDPNVIPFSSKVNPHNFDQNCWVRLSGFCAISIQLVDFEARPASNAWLGDPRTCPVAGIRELREAVR